MIWVEETAGPFVKKVFQKKLEVLKQTGILSILVCHWKDNSHHNSFDVIQQEWNQQRNMFSCVSRRTIKLRLIGYIPYNQTSTFRLIKFSKRIHLIYFHCISLIKIFFIVVQGDVTITSSKCCWAKNIALLIAHIRTMFCPLHWFISNQQFKSSIFFQLFLEEKKGREKNSHSSKFYLHEVFFQQLHKNPRTLKIMVWPFCWVFWFLFFNWF